MDQVALLIMLGAGCWFFGFAVGMACGMRS